MTTAQKEQENRRTILILIKNEFQKMIEDGRTIGKRTDGRFVHLKDVYDDLQNFLYGKDFTGLPYLVSIEEVEHYRNLLKEIKQTDKERIDEYFRTNGDSFRNQWKKQ